MMEVPRALALQFEAGMFPNSETRDVLFGTVWFFSGLFWDCRGSSGPEIVVETLLGIRLTNMNGIIPAKSIIVAIILPLVIVLSSDHIQYP